MTESEREELPHSPESCQEPWLRLTLAGLAGPFCWVLHFAILYLLEGLFCRPGTASPQLIIVIIFTVTLVFGGACAWLTLASKYWLQKAGARRTQTGDFLVSLNRTLAGLSLLAIMWAAAGVFFLSPCTAAY